MENDANSNQQDQGELLQQLSQLRNELARKQKKLKKSRRSEKVKEHVKRKLQEQAQLNEDISQNCLNKSSVPSTLVSNSPSSASDHSCKEISSHMYTLEDRHTSNNSLIFSSRDKEITNGKFQAKYFDEKESNLFIEDDNSCKSGTFKTTKHGQMDISSDSSTKLDVANTFYLNKGYKTESFNHMDVKYDNKYYESDGYRSCGGKKIPEASVRKCSSHEDKEASGLQPTNVSDISNDKCILKSPSSISGNRTDISPDIPSGESSIEEIDNLRSESKNNHRLIGDSLAVTPSFVSTRIPPEEQVSKEDTEVPWHFDSELTDIKLRLNFNPDTQHCDNISQKCKCQPIVSKNCLADEDSQKIQGSKESQTATLHFDVQNYDGLTCTPTSFSDSETNELSYQRSDVGTTLHNRTLEKGFFRQCEIEALFPNIEQSKQITDKSVEQELHKTSICSYDQKDNCFGMSDTKDNSSHSVSDDVVNSKATCKADWLSKKKIMENQQIMFDNRQMNQNEKQFETLPFSFKERDIQKSQTSSLPCIVRNISSKVGKHLSITRKRRRSNSFSDFSRNKKIKRFNDLTIKSFSGNKCFDDNVVNRRQNEYGLMENTERCPDTCRSDNICYVISSDPDNINHLCKKPTKTLKHMLSSTVDTNDKPDVMLESHDSDSSDSSLSQSLLRPALSKKENKVKNKELDKVYEQSDLSLKVYRKISSVNCSKNYSFSDKPNKGSQSHQTNDSKRTCGGHHHGGFDPHPVDVIDLSESLENEKPHDRVTTEKEHCSQTVQIYVDHQTKSSCSDLSQGSSEDDVKIIEDISSQNGKDTADSTKHDHYPVTNYLDFTELDAIPFSQMELSESFLSDPEAYQTERMKGSCHGRKSPYGMFVPRKSPRLTSDIASVHDRHNSQTSSLSTSSCTSSSQLSSNSKQFVSRRTRKSRKSLMISSLFQFLVDEAKRKSEEEFFLSKIQYGCLLDAKCNETPQVESPESALKHLTETKTLNLVHECSEELYSQDDLNDDKHTISNICRINPPTGKYKGKITVDNQIHIDVDTEITSVCNQTLQVDVLENKDTLVKYDHEHSLSSRHSPDINDHTQKLVQQRGDICKKDQKLSQSTSNDFLSAISNYDKLTEVPCCQNNSSVQTNNVNSPKQKFASEAGREKCLHGLNREFSVLSPNRGSFHRDACLPSDYPSSESSSETYSETTLSTVITEISSKIHGKGWLRHVSCFQTGKNEPVLSLTSGTVMSNNEGVQFVACVSEYCLSLWSADKQDVWTNELDWLLPLGCCAKNLWLLPHKTKAALLISGLKNETVSWVLLFVYHWQSGESSRLNLDLPVTNMSNVQNSLLCCPLMDNQVILSCRQSAMTFIQKYSLADSLGEISSQQCLEGTKHKLLSLSLVEDLNLALIGLSDDSHILVWNHMAGTLLTQIDVSLVLPCPQSLACVQAVKGYLFLLVMNRSFENPGSFLAINPHIEMCKLLFHLERCNGKTQSLKKSVVTNKVMAAVDEDGDIILWDKYYGNLLAHLPQSNSTAIHLSKGLLFTGQENGCVHTMEIK